MIVDVYFVENRIIVEKDNNDIDHNSFLCSRTLPVGLGVSENEYFDLILVIRCSLSSFFWYGSNNKSLKGKSLLIITGINEKNIS